MNLNVLPLTNDLQNIAQNFNCGNSHLDAFIKSSLALDYNYGKTYVLISETKDEIIGYYNIGMGYIDILDNGLHWKIGGAVHINGFALDVAYHGLVKEELPDGCKINLSDFLLYDCIKRIREIREQYIGCAFITLCTTTEGYSLYERIGFEELDADMNFSIEFEEVNCKLMYYTIDNI